VSVTPESITCVGLSVAIRHPIIAQLPCFDSRFAATGVVQPTCSAATAARASPSRVLFCLHRFAPNC